MTPLLEEGADTPSTARAGQWMRDYVAETLSRTDLESFIDNVCQSMGADVPELSTDAEIQRDLELAVRSQFRLILAVRRSDTSPRWSIPATEEGRSLARTIARRGLELRFLSQLYHAGHRAVWRFVSGFVNDADLPADFKVQLVVVMWEQTSEVMNSMLADLAATYTQEHERLLSGAFSMRVNTVREILDGTQQSTDEASVQLGYPLHRTHTALVLWTTDHAISIDAQIFEPLARRLARSADATEILCVPSGLRGLWVWMVSRNNEEPTIDSALVPPGVRVAVGRPGQGIDGFRRTHREAQAAQAIAARARQDRSVTSYRDVELVSMLASRPDAMSTLVERELPGMLGEDELSARLRETLRAVLSQQGNLESQLASSPFTKTPSGTACNRSRSDSAGESTTGRFTWNWHSTASIPSAVRSRRMYRQNKTRERTWTTRPSHQTCSPARLKVDSTSSSLKDLWQWPLRPTVKYGEGFAMKTKGALLWGINEKWSVEEIELGDPVAGEVQIRWKPLGHVPLRPPPRHRRTPMASYPAMGGHEGAGVVIKVGEGVTDLKVGDHVVLRLHPGLWTLPVVLVGPFEPLRPRHGTAAAARPSPTAPTASRPAGRTWSR